MASAADIGDLDRLGAVLRDMGAPRASVEFQKGQSGDFFNVSWKDRDGRYFSGHGDTPSQAYAAALRWQAIKVAGGVHVDA